MAGIGPGMETCYAAPEPRGQAGGCEKEASLERIVMTGSRIAGRLGGPLG